MVAVHEALLTCILGDTEAAGALVAQATNGFAGGLGTAVLLQIAGPLTGIKQVELSALLGPLLVPLPSITEVMELVELLALVQKRESHRIPQLFKYVLTTPLKAAIVLPHSNAQYARLLEMLYTANQWPLLAAYAAAALKDTPDAPLFVYYQCLAKCRGRVIDLAKKDRKRMIAALEAAEAAGDARTAKLIDDALGHTFAVPLDILDILREQIMNELGGKDPFAPQRRSKP